QALPTPHATQKSLKPIRPLWQVEKEAILEARLYCNGSVVKAAALLEISKSYIYKKLKQWKEEAEEN
ncbi:MAG TPA: sigma-54-dependent Fis family transcriptional regulator, partial [Thioploca sp.]|nr:sigma-54-dependent Fis family transcriptional regulator [Thioploca sp.]